MCRADTSRFGRYRIAPSPANAPRSQPGTISIRVSSFFRGNGQGRCGFSALLTPMSILPLLSPNYEQFGRLGIVKRALPGSIFFQTPSGTEKTVQLVFVQSVNRRFRPAIEPTTGAPQVHSSTPLCFSNIHRSSQHDQEQTGLRCVRTGHRSGQQPFAGHSPSLHPGYPG